MWSEWWHSYESFKERKLGIIISGRKGENYIDFSEPLDSKYLSDLFTKINLDFGDEIIRIERHKLKSKIKTPIYALEVCFQEKIDFSIDYPVPEKSLKSFDKYHRSSEYPSSYRDLSFLIKNPSKIKILHQKLAAANTKYLKKLFMFDFYENKQKSETKIGYRFIFQSSSKTLTDNDIENSIEDLLKDILLIEYISIPGRF